MDVCDDEKAGGEQTAGQKSQQSDTVSQSVCLSVDLSGRG